MKPVFSFRSKEQRRLHAEICSDCKDMDDYARPARDQAKEAIQGYMALALDANRNDGRSRIFPPALHGIVYSRISMEAANVPSVTFKHRKASSEPKMQWLNSALKASETGDGNLRPHSTHLWYNQNFDKVLLGLGARYQSYLLQTRLVRVTGQDGKPVTKTMIVHDDIWDENVDFFHFGVSRDMLPGMFQGRACYMDKFFPRDAFMERFDTPFYENINKVPEDDWFRGDDDNAWDVPKGFVRVRFYWDLYKDLYYVLANGIPIRQDYILEYGASDRPKKYLPISTIHNDLSYQNLEPSTPTIMQGGRAYGDTGQSATAKSFWTMGDAYLVKGLIALKRSLWRAAADNVKASSVHFLLAKSAGVYDQVRTTDLYGIVPLKSDDAGFDVKSLTEGSTFLEKWLETDSHVDDMVTYILGNDWRRAANEMTNEKATVAAIKQQVQRLRSAQNSKWNDGPIQRHYAIRLNLIQQFYVEPTEVPVEGELPDGIEEQDVVRDADGRPVAYKKYKEIPTDKDVVEIKKDGKYKLVDPDHPDVPKGAVAERVFKGRKDFLLTEEEPEIYIEPGSTFAEMKALEQSLMNDKLATLQPFFGLAYPNDQGMPAPIIPKEGAEYAVEKWAEVNEWDPDRLLNKRNKDDLGDDDEMIEPFAGTPNPAMPAMPQMPQQPGQPQLSVGPGSSIGKMAAAVTV